MVQTLILYACLSGLPILVGGLASYSVSNYTHHYRDSISHAMIAMGGGILIASIAFVLVPHSIIHISPLPACVSFIFGAGLFAYLDKKITTSGHSSAQVLAMLMDFIPEIMALGASFSQDPKLGFLLALFIGIQNLPEGFNAYNELTLSKKSPMKSLVILGLLSLIGIIPTLLGYYAFKDSITLISIIMLSSAGGILYLVFQDIIPLSKVQNTTFSAFSGVVGFLIGLLGYMFFS